MPKNGARRSVAASIAGSAAIVAALLGSSVQGQPSGGSVAVTAQWTTSQDHRDMQSQLGIRELRPGRNADASAPNAANYDEALANPFPILPDPLVSKSGERITTAQAWWSVRRPEIIEDFEREVVGRV